MSEKLPSGSQISHYRVSSKIGAGGMCEVYLVQMDRKVAVHLKVSDPPALIFTLKLVDV